MSILRLPPVQLPVDRPAPGKRCSACGERLLAGDEVVHMYGEKFHRGCAFYRSQPERRAR